MWSRPESDEALVKRFLPSTNPDRVDRAHAWAEWQLNIGEAAVLKFIRLHNNTGEADEDIFQEAMLTAYMEVERGRYQLRDGVPFTAYVKGIARNKIREARRRGRYWTGLDDLLPNPTGSLPRELEVSIEHREQYQALVHGLSRLPVQRRQVLERYMSGQTTPQIAGELAITEELVRQHKCRGLRALRQLSAAQSGEEQPARLPL